MEWQPIENVFKANPGISKQEWSNPVYLLLTDGKKIRTGYYKEREWLVSCIAVGYDNGYEYINPTHWMPLPPLPREVK